MNMNTMISRLKQDGWNLKEEFWEEFLQNVPNMNYSEITKYLLNADLKDIGCSSLSSDAKKANQFPTPLILQVTNVRNIAAPKSNEESGAAPRMLRITLTDGIGFINSIEFAHIKSLGGETPPGTKVKLLSKVPIAGGHLLLTSSNTDILGGIVEELFEKWKFSQSVSKYSRMIVAADGSGPPPWVAFGQKIIDSKESEGSSSNVKSSTEFKVKVDDEFQNQRNQTVMELAKDSTHKVFGGGKHMLDSNIQKIVNAGFTIEEAEWGLKRSRNDPSRAIRELRMAIEGGPSYTAATNDQETSFKSSGRGGRGRGRGRGKDRDRGPDGSDEDIPQMGKMRPSGPASLSDFFESKMLEKKETMGFPEEKRDTNTKYNRRDSGGGRGYREKTAASASGSANLTSASWPVVGEAPQPVPPPPMRSSQQTSYSEHRNHESSNRGDHYMRGYGKSDYGQRYNQDRSAQAQNPSYQRPYAQSNYHEQNRNYNTNYEYNHPGQPRRDQPRFNDRNNYHNQPAYGSNIPRGGSRGRGYPRYHAPQNFTHQQQNEYQNPPQQYRDNYEQYQDERAYSSHPKSSDRGYSVKEKELIAKFQQSMILSGHYEQDHFGTQNQAAYGNFPQTDRGSYHGSLEYRRGGEGYARRGSERGARGGEGRGPSY